KPALIEKGWKIVVSPQFEFDILPTPANWFVDVDEGSGMDWFNLELGVEIDGKKISLLPVFLHMIQANGKKIEELIQSDTKEFIVEIAD
ncbi:hypothetical protein U2075_14765, partial [Listeria monocytogenes]|uniref:hypothetical protein n=1 Tax=Listeria monocytogenes TaxID=1639 RepID=UPI002FDB9EBA